MAQQLNQLKLCFSAGAGVSSIENNFKISSPFHLPSSGCKDMKLEPAMFLSSFTSASLSWSQIRLGLKQSA